jgi:hypothetical protein
MDDLLGDITNRVEFKLNPYKVYYYFILLFCTEGIFPFPFPMSSPNGFLSPPDQIPALAAHVSKLTQSEGGSTTGRSVVSKLEVR